MGVLGAGLAALPTPLSGQMEGKAPCRHHLRPATGCSVTASHFPTRQAGAGPGVPRAGPSAREASSSPQRRFLGSSGPHHPPNPGRDPLPRNGFFSPAGPGLPHQTPQTTISWSGGWESKVEVLEDSVPDENSLHLLMVGREGRRSTLPSLLLIGVQVLPWGPNLMVSWEPQIPLKARSPNSTTLR